MKTKSSIMKLIAEQTGMQLVDIRISTLEPTDLHGLPYPDLSTKGALNEAIDAVVEERIVRDIKVGDMVLMEIAQGVMETVLVEEIDEDMVYGLGEDGEPYCSLLSNCDKVPF